MNNKLLTRRQIIKAWKKNKDYLDYFCCSDCNTVLRMKLVDGVNWLYCGNYKCNNSEVYKMSEAPNE